ncbi:MAG: TIGR04053 family radical SAM/SPASM domain-containing protein [Thermoleophilia bacterium]|nr:TIGR04053 family radical SAM/SPASM domain-containing protein [Thermoleophilia bacterium]
MVASRAAARPLRSPRGAERSTRPRIDLERRPILVFWETTRACLLACRHCRASAIPRPLPGELSTEEGERLIESLTRFGRPFPVLVLTGGDVLMRADLVRLATYASELGLPVAVSPSVTPRLEPRVLAALRQAGVKVASISLDGASAATHEGLRGIEGHLPATLEAIRLLREHGFTVQVNTVVRPENVEELPEIAALVHAGGARIWEVFFLVRVGRGSRLRELAPHENEDVCHFLVDASRYGFVVRTVEAPFFRRVVAWRGEGRACETGPLYERLATRLRALLGEPSAESRAQTKGTRDGKGIVFVSYDGDVYPAGFLPLALGNVRRRSLPDIYQGSPLLREIRAARFHGRCGACEYADLCGGSRARAYAASGDPLGEDPACPYAPVGAARRDDGLPRGA